MTQPNIILVMCDDLGYGDVGFNGGQHTQTPCLDSIAKDSVRFSRFYAGGPVCSPTRGTCLTGRHYIRYGINHANQGRLPVEERTLATICRDAGYATGHFGKWHLGTLSAEGKDGNRGGCDPRLYSPPWLHGFDVCFSTESKVPTWDPMMTPDEMNPGGTPRWGTPGEQFGTAYWDESGKRVTENLDGCDCRVIMDRAEPFIRQAVECEQPFMSVIWFHAPHTPVVAGPEWRALYPNATEEEQHYYGCVSAMDAQMGRLDKLLHDLQITNDTILWFCSDNGPEGGEILHANGRCQGSTGGLRGRKRSLYEGGVGVPALLRWPTNLPATMQTDTPCSTLDILPTCCAVINADAPSDRPLDGINILPLLQDPSLPRPTMIPYRFLETSRKMFGSPTFAVMDGQWKFLTNLDPEKAHDQLYDMEADRMETENLVAAHPEVQARCHAFLKDFIASCRASHSGSDYSEAIDMITEFQEPGGWKE